MRIPLLGSWTSFQKETSIEYMKKSKINYLPTIPKSLEYPFCKISTFIRHYRSSEIHVYICTSIWDFTYNMDAQRFLFKNNSYYGRFSSNARFFKEFFSNVWAERQMLKPIFALDHIKYACCNSFQLAFRVIGQHNLIYMKHFHTLSHECHSVLHVLIHFLPVLQSWLQKWYHEIIKVSIILLSPDPVDTECTLNVHKTFKRSPGRLLNVLRTFSFRPVSTGECKIDHW